VNERKDLPTAMRYVGWSLCALTLLYPVDAVHTWYVTRDLLAAEVVPVVTGHGMAFDLRTQVIHCGILGWLGGVATAFSLLWLILALVAWGSRRMKRQAPLGASSRRVSASVFGGVLLVVATQQYFQHVLGVLLI
jgi:hypothetical protein